jgi:hypothetical protein
VRAHTSCSITSSVVASTCTSTCRGKRTRALAWEGLARGARHRQDSGRAPWRKKVSAA